jgi:hypothetical protein
MRLLLSLCLLGVPAALNAATLVERPDTATWPPYVIADPALTRPDDVLSETSSKITSPGPDAVMRVFGPFDPGSDAQVLGLALSEAGGKRAFQPPVSAALRWRRPQGGRPLAGNESMRSQGMKPGIHQVPLPPSFAAMLAVLSGWLFLCRQSQKCNAPVKFPGSRLFRRANLSPAVLCRDFRRLSPESP